MTVQHTPAAGGPPPRKREDEVACTIDGFEIIVPQGTLVIRAAEMLGVQIPRFCDHPLLEPVGACRQCLVEVTDRGDGKPMPKPQASCALSCSDGMVVKTQLTSQVAEKAQNGQMEFLLINHPLDCPICDKGGECPLQNQAMTNGYAETRFRDVKRTYPKPISLSSQVLLDRERCVLCARCTRFSKEIAGDPFIELLERGALEQIGIYEDQPFESYFSGNTVQICPVGALTGATYRFRSRPFDLVSSPSVCEHCASGCQQRTDHRRGQVLRRLAGDDHEVNEEWNCDKGRWAFKYATQPDRLTHPLVRGGDGGLEPAAWPEALDVAARGLAEARGSAGVLAGGRLTLEDAYGYAKFARVALATNNVDMRARPHSPEEADFLGARVAGRGMETTYADLEAAPAVVLAGFEPEEESPIVFLRLRKAARKQGEQGLKVYDVAPFATKGLTKTYGELIRTVPGREAETLDALAAESEALDATGTAAATALRREGAVILAGERLAAAPGALSAVSRLAADTGAKLAWVPRRAGERGALEAGTLPALLPMGRPVTDEGARAEVARAWGVAELPAESGHDTAGVLAAAAGGDLGALLVAGVDPHDLPDPRAALEALEAAPFVVSLEQRASEVTDRADVVFPVAAVAEKPGTFLDWEGRGRQFETAVRGVGHLSDLQVLTAIADEMDVHLGLPNPEAARHELAALGRWPGGRLAAPTAPPGSPPNPEAGRAVLASWHLLLDAGRLQDGEPYLAGTAKAAHTRASAATVAEAGLDPDSADGAPLAVATQRGSVTLPLVVTDMPDRVVWLPTNSAGCAVRRDLASDAGGVVEISAGDPADLPSELPSELASDATEGRLS